MTPEGKELYGDYIVTMEGQIYSKKTKRFLAPCSTKKTAQICFCFNGKRIFKVISKLVADLFVPNPNGYRFIHHKNGHIEDNRAENLEWWYSTKYKDNHQIPYKGKIGRSGFPIEGFDDNGNVVKYYESLRAAGRDGISPSSISRCIRGLKKSFNGLRWRYAEETRGI